METKIFQWENENALRSFPFMEDTKLVDDYGNRLPDNLIVDLSICSQANSIFGGVSQNFRVSCVHIGPGLVSVAIVNKNKGILAITESRENIEPWRPYALESIANGYSGYITFGDFTWPEKPITYVFSHWNPDEPEESQAIIDSRAILPLCGPEVEKFVDSFSGEEASGVVEFIFPDIIARDIIPMSSEYGIGNWVYLNLKNRNVLAGPCFAVGPQVQLKGVCGVPLTTSISNVKPNSEGTIMLRFK